MSLVEKIDQDLISAVKAKDISLATVLRTIKSALQNAAIDNRGELGDEQATSILQKEAKKRREAIDLYEQSQRTELAEQENRELQVLEKYLPQPMSAEEVAEIIDTAISEVGATNVSDMGAVMKKVAELDGGRIDRGEAASVVREKLNEK